MWKILLVFIAFFLSFGVVHAQGEFRTSYVTNYKFDAQGNSTIQQLISLTNLQTQVYAASYQFTLSGPPPAIITGKDAKGPLTITTEAKGDSTLVTVNFNDQIVGKGNTQTFELDYTGPIATHNGQIWEIILPGLSPSDFIDDYQLNLQTDPLLGKLALVSPQPVISGNTYTFNKQQLEKIGVVAAFGNFQTFGFDLKYQLQNFQKDPVFAEIAIPADTNYQRVFYDSLTPKPANVRVDEDGNWLARYNLQARQQIEVEAKGQAHLLAEPVKLFSDQVQKPDIQKYLRPTKYWPSIDPQMSELGQKLKTPEAIFNYVASILSYDYSQNPGTARLRKGGKEALATPDTSVCLEFTDLFITLARAAGIPAREVDGYAYAQDTSSHPLSLESDVLHAWPQYWDAQREMWINVDPTWTNTTGGVDYFHQFDFNHFAFVVHGLDDSAPLSAGLYKTSATAKDVSVSFASYNDYPQQDLNFVWHAPWQINPLQNTYSAVTIANNQGQARYHIDANVSVHNFTLLSDVLTHIIVLPPFGSIDIPVVMQKGQYLNFAPQSFQVRVGQQTMAYNIGSRLYLAWHISVGLIASLIILGLAALAVRAGGIYLQRSQRGNNLRGQGQEPKA